jgi:hypothetical protein
MTTPEDNANAPKDENYEQTCIEANRAAQQKIMRAERGGARILLEGHELKPGETLEVREGYRVAVPPARPIKSELPEPPTEDGASTGCEFMHPDGSYRAYPPEDKGVAEPPKEKPKD